MATIAASGKRPQPRKTRPPPPEAPAHRSRDTASRSARGTARVAHPPAIQQVRTWQARIAGPLGTARSMRCSTSTRPPNDAYRAPPKTISRKRFAPPGSSAESKEKPTLPLPTTVTADNCITAALSAGTHSPPRPTLQITFRCGYRVRHRIPFHRPSIATAPLGLQPSTKVTGNRDFVPRQGVSDVLAW